MTLKSKLSVKKEYISSAHKKLVHVEKHRKNILSKKQHKNIKSNVGKNVGIDGKITYVGVHNRRSDHIKFMREREKREPLDESYFAFAFQYFGYICVYSFNLRYWRYNINRDLFVILILIL